MEDAFIYQPPAASPLNALYGDKDVVAFDKPSGLLTNPGRGELLADCLLSRVQQQWPTALLVHRLDMATSGVVVFALRKKAEANLKQQFATRETKKIYIARVAGHLDTARGDINAPLAADPMTPPRNRVDAAGKAAHTYYEVLKHDHYLGQPSTLVALWPTTGRAHQLRVHLAWLGHPILGDALYASPSQHAPRLLLHAYRLGFRQPYQQTWLELTAPLDLALFATDPLPTLDFLAHSSS